MTPDRKPARQTTDAPRKNPRDVDSKSDETALVELSELFTLGDKHVDIDGKLFAKLEIALAIDMASDESVKNSKYASVYLRNVLTQFPLSNASSTTEYRFDASKLPRDSSSQKLGHMRNAFYETARGLIASVLETVETLVASYKLKLEVLREESDAILESYCEEDCEIPSVFREKYGAILSESYCEEDGAIPSMFHDFTRYGLTLSRSLVPEPVRGKTQFVDYNAWTSIIFQLHQRLERFSDNTDAWVMMHLLFSENDCYGFYNDINWILRDTDAMIEGTTAHRVSTMNRELRMFHKKIQSSRKTVPAHCDTLSMPEDAFETDEVIVDRDVSRKIVYSV